MSRTVFIGHGRSPLWKDLEKFLTSKLELPCDEFESICPAGKTIVGRLEEMLDKACFAFLIMTGEDSDPDGSVHARHNVIHEIGLFQGRLGFAKAIVLLEDGCKEFSNIHGLAQIRFPREDISARFEKIREVLLREGILNPDRQRGLANTLVEARVGANSGTNFRFLEEVYWEVSDLTISDGPYCPRCYDADEKRCRMRKSFVSGVADMDDVKFGGHYWICNVCGAHFERNPAGLYIGIKVRNDVTDSISCFSKRRTENYID